MTNRYSQIPFNLLPFQNKSAYFVTYYGDIYFGSLWECVGYDDGFFIIPKHNLHQAQDLTRQRAPSEQFRSLGWEINDYRVIRQVLPEKTVFGNSAIKPIHFAGQKFSQMFVFGAAASTFCVFGEAREKFRNSTYNPPTGFEIFDDKYTNWYKKYPAAMQSIPEFESRNRDIEACLDDEWCSYKGRYSPDITARHINIQFYLQELFNEISAEVIAKEYRYNLYGLFCNKLQKQLAEKQNEVALLISFNYDTILDHFVGSFSSHFSTMEDYYDWHHRNIVLFKPHGSANWGWRFQDSKVGTVTQSELSQQLFSRKIEPWQIYYDLLGDISQTVEYGSWGLEKKYSVNKNLIQVINSSSSRSRHYPALLLPYRDKDEFVMPYQMQHAMSSCFNQVTELFLIGWKGNEERFNHELKQQCHGLKKITIVNPQPSSVKDNLRKYGLDLSRYEIREIENFERFVLDHF